MTDTWASIIQELQPAMGKEHANILGSTMTIADGVATVHTPTEDNGKWLLEHFTHVLKMRIRANGLPCDIVRVEF